MQAQEKIVEVPGVGNVKFPGDMSDEQIAAVIQRNLLATGAGAPALPRPSVDVREINPLGAGENNAMRSLASGFLKGIAETGAGLADLVHLRRLTPGDREYFTPENTAESVGKGLEAAVEFAPVAGPISKLGRLSALKSAGVPVLERIAAPVTRTALAGATGATQAAMHGELDDAAEGALYGAAGEAAVEPVTRGALRLAGRGLLRMGQRVPVAGGLADMVADKLAAIRQAKQVPSEIGATRFREGEFLPDVVIKPRAASQSRLNQAGSLGLKGAAAESAAIKDEVNQQMQKGQALAFLQKKGKGSPKLIEPDDIGGIYRDPRMASWEHDALGLLPSKFGLKVSANRTEGIWQGAVEPSYRLDVQGDVRKALAYAAEIGKRGDQDAVAVFTHKPGGRGVRIELSGVTNRNAVARDMRRAGIDAGTFDGDKLIIFDDDARGAIQRASQIAQKRNLDIKTAPGEFRLLDRSRYDDAIAGGVSGGTVAENRRTEIVVIRMAGAVAASGASEARDEKAKKLAEYRHRR